LSESGLQDFQDKKWRPRNQRYECHWQNARLAFCMIPRGAPTEYKMSDFAVLTPTYEDCKSWLRQIMIEHPRVFTLG